LTWTSAFGKGSGWLLQKIVNGLALTRISPNMLTFIGLVINIIAACFFGFARAYNANRMFLYAGLIIMRLASSICGSCKATRFGVWLL
jgi:CDP-diacylglycerol--glycerol-3-phosphate 3-phosphatidyltransferase